MSASCPVSARVCRETAKERDELRAEVERLRAALIALVDEWEATGRSDSHPLIRGAAPLGCRAGAGRAVARGGRR